MCTRTFEGIIDSTLREGGQTPGVDFSFTEKINILRGLAMLGVDEIELVVASPLFPELPGLVKTARRIFRGTGKFSLWCRCRTQDISFAAGCRPDILSLSIPVSDLHLGQKLSRDRQWALNTIEGSIAHARRSGIQYISVGLEDATRADREFVSQVVTIAASAGASRIRLADTVGIGTPGTISSLVRHARRYCSLPIGIHAHNDFGMATANSVAALEAGAGWADATILGLGERAGNCRLEELVGYLSLAGNTDRYRPAELHGLCTLVAAAADLSISRQHPVVGEAIFTCESGLHVHGLVNNPATYEPYDPRRIGRSRSIRYGEKTGKRAVRNSLASMGLLLTEEEAGHLVARVRHDADRRNRSLDEMELFALARKEGIAFPGLNSSPDCP